MCALLVSSWLAADLHAFFLTCCLLISWENARKEIASHHVRETMTCKRCPHHVRHGKVGEDGKSIEFSDHCGLRLKQAQDTDPTVRKGRGRGRPAAEVVKRKPLPQGATTRCVNFPFSHQFDYFHCKVYQETFESKGLKNGVVPTKDFQYSERLAGVAVTDMELL